MISSKPIFQRVMAEHDVDGALNYDLTESVDAAMAFIDDLESCFKFIAMQPKAGANRYAHELNIPNLKTWELPHFPYVVFYFEKTDHIDVWRILHSKSDIPNWMQ